MWGYRRCDWAPTQHWAQRPQRRVRTSAHHRKLRRQLQRRSHQSQVCERDGALLVEAVRPMAWMGRRSSLLARYAVDATRRPVAARHSTEEARAKGSVATTTETRGVTPPNGRHTQTPSTYSPVFVPLRRHPRPMALVSKCPRRKVGGFSARAARCPRRSSVPHGRSITRRRRAARARTSSRCRRAPRRRTRGKRA